MQRLGCKADAPSATGAAVGVTAMHGALQSRRWPTQRLSGCTLMPSCQPRCRLAVPPGGVAAMARGWRGADGGAARRGPTWQTALNTPAHRQHALLVGKPVWCNMMLPIFSATRTAYLRSPPAAPRPPANLIERPRVRHAREVVHRRRRAGGENGNNGRWRAWSAPRDLDTDSPCMGRAGWCTALAGRHA